MSATKTPIAVGQVRKDPDTDGYVRVMRILELGYMNDYNVLPCDSAGWPTGARSRFLCAEVLGCWPIVVPTQQEPKP